MVLKPLTRLLDRRRKNRERLEEIETHIAEASDYYISRGVEPAEARRVARLRFGNPRAYGERMSDMNQLPVLDVLGRDVSFAFRRIRKAPAFSAAIILTLALVVGATSSVFSLADAILLRPLPVPHPEQLSIVGFRTVSPKGEYVAPDLDGMMFNTVRDNVKLIDVAVGNFGAQGVNFVSNGAPSFVQNQLVGDGFFRVLGVSPLIGREFSAADVKTGGPAVAILSEQFWQKLFQRDQAVIGKTILLRGEPYTVIGVMPNTFRGLTEADVWTPLRGLGQGLNYDTIARRHDGASIEAANAELLALGGAPFADMDPVPNVKWNLVLDSLQENLVKQARQPIEMLGWAVGTVLLIACVNIAALLLARGGVRAKEVATRMALGSGRTAIIRQLMVESLVLALIGGVLGVFVGFAGLEGLKSLGGTTFGEWRDATLSGRTIGLTLGLAAATSVLFGLLPAWQTSRIDVQRALTAGGSRSIAGGSRHIARRVLVVAEVALGVVMLVAAGLLMRQFASLRSIKPGFAPDHLYTVNISLQDARYKEAGAVNQLFNASLERLRQTAGVESAAVSQRLPYERLLNLGFTVEGREVEPGHHPIANVAYVTPSFLRTFGIPLIAGRDLDDRDRAGMPPVVVVNKTFADIYFPKEAVVGRPRVFGGGSGAATVENAGEASDVQQNGTGLNLEGMHRGPILTSPTVYFPTAQVDPALFRWFSPAWTVRASSGAVAAEALTRAIGSVDPLLPIADVRSMKEVVARSLAAPRLMMSLVGALALAALLLSAIGIHGLITHMIAERSREFGVRLALGASPGQIVRSVALSGIVLSAIGVVLGLGLSVPATKLVEASLTELTTKDAPTYIGVALLLFVVAAASSVWPALRVARLDPVKTLRE
jgi:predicted permease